MLTGHSFFHRHTHTQFTNNANEIIHGSEGNAQKIFGDAIKISDSLTSFALATNATWPFVTLPNFEIATSQPFASNVGAELVMFTPKVPKRNRRAFEEYAHKNQGWIGPADDRKGGIGASES